MNKKEEFKLFVSKHPELLNYVKNRSTTWQDFYEMYALYGSESSIWNDYITNTNEKLSFSELLEVIKKVDVDNLQKNITNINKGLALIESLITKNPEVNDYTPTPLYKKFED